MATRISQFHVEGLFGGRSVRLEFSDNKLILVGENGSGKSTLLNALFYFLTARWGDLSTIPATSYELHLENGESASVSSVHLRKESRRRRKYPRPVDPSVDVLFDQVGRGTGRRILAEIEARFSKESYDDEKRLVRLERETGLPTHLLEELVHAVRQNRRKTHSTISDCEEILARHLPNPVMFLPTYRRIEKELPEIFGRDLEASDRRLRDARRTGRGYYELVEFGMADVKRAFTNAMATLDRQFRGSLNALTGLYLTDIINQEYNELDVGRLGRPETLKAIRSTLRRVPEATLSNVERPRLEGLLEKLQSGVSLDLEDRILAHFLSRLSEIHAEQEKSEARVRSLVGLCNKYLTNKVLTFDSDSFDLYLTKSASHATLRQQETLPGMEPEKPVSPENRLALDKLSSGEKQVVSLFSHLLLTTEDEGYILLIDEPELSISVPWQRSLLEDVVATERCASLVAVTHSPFVFKNSLKSYARSMHELTVG